MPCRHVHMLGCKLLQIGVRRLVFGGDDAPGDPTPARNLECRQQRRLVVRVVLCCRPHHGRGCAGGVGRTYQRQPRRRRSRVRHKRSAHRARDDSVDADRRRVPRCKLHRQCVHPVHRKRRPRFRKPKPFGAGGIVKPWCACPGGRKQSGVLFG